MGIDQGHEERGGVRVGFFEASGVRFYYDPDDERSRREARESARRRERAAPL
jgi:hypothetical protein